METALDVLSRAATMVQDTANEGRLTSKELPTAKWRRDRRLRAGEYHTGGNSGGGGSVGGVPAPSSSSSASPPGTPPPPMPLHSLNVPMAHTHSGAGSAPPPIIMNHIHHQQHVQHSMDSPIDMSVTSTTMKHRASPPPPYREPLPGSTFASSLARPSVITQAPPKRDSHDSHLISNRENEHRINIGEAEFSETTLCERVIEEHFRRSLGPDYVALFSKKSPVANSTPSPQPLSTAATNTPNPTPPLPSHAATAMSQQSQSQSPLTSPSTPTNLQAHHHSPPYAHSREFAYSQALISPKPSAVLLSPAAMTVQIKSDMQSPHLVEKSSQSQSQPQSHSHSQPGTPPIVVSLPPPQQQPLALSQRSNSPQRRAVYSPQPQTQPQAQPLAMIGSSSSLNRSSPMQAQYVRSSVTPPELHTTTTTRTHTRTPSPPQPQSPAIAPAAAAAAAPAFTSTVMSPSSHQSPVSKSASTIVDTSSSPPIAADVAVSGSAAPTVPALMRVKTEPGVTGTNTPPASPTSYSEESCSTNSVEVTASVDDHFAKALGDTWKKLQENKEIRK